MFMSSKIFNFNILILFGLIISVISDCHISIPQDPSLIPNFNKYVGTHKIKVTSNKFGENILRLHELQELEADCDINFVEPEAFKTSNKIYLKCQAANYIYIATDKYYTKNSAYYGNLILECSSLKWNLYESVSNFAWCPSNVTSYILARPKMFDVVTSTYNYLAGICYDIYNNSFYSAYYILAPSNFENKQPEILRESYEPLIKIDYVRETFGTNNLPRGAFKDYAVDTWMFNFNYEFRSMIPHNPDLYSGHNEEFASLLEFVWWSNLRSYNWNRYINALEANVNKDNKSYDILAGVSGTIKVPVVHDCEKNYTMEEVKFDVNRKIPLYVWNYLQDPTNTTNEVVIIGFNSPFDEFYSPDDLNFCPDRCQEIPWLKEASKFFRYKIMGFIICCTVEDVRASQILHGFPENDIYPKSLKTTEIPNILD